MGYFFSIKDECLSSTMRLEWQFGIVIMSIGVGSGVKRVWGSWVDGCGGIIEILV